MNRRAALADALDALEAQAGQVVMTSLRRTIGRVVRTLDTDSWPITASAEDELTRLLDEWGIEVDARVLPMFHEVYGAGGMAAVARMGELGYDPFDSEVIAQYMDEGARDHLLASRNRFLEVGNRAWELARRTMADGFEAGEGVDKIARELRRVLDLSEARAMMVARTEVISAANAGATRRIDIAAANGEDVPPYKQWLSTLDTRTRPTHVTADGEVVERDAKFQVGGSMLAYPGDPVGAAKEVINCRCTILFVDTPEGETDVEGRQEGGVVEDAERELGESVVLRRGERVIPEWMVRAVRDAHLAGKHSQKSHGKGGDGGGSEGEGGRSTRVGGKTRTGLSLSEMGRRGEQQFVANQDAAGVSKRFGRVRETAKGSSGQNPIDIESDTHAIEVKTLDSRAPRLSVNIKSHEVSTKQSAADASGKKGTVVAQVYDAGSGTMHVFAFEGGFAPSTSRSGRGTFELTGTRTGRPVSMERVGSYRVDPGTFDADVIGLAAAALGDRDADGDEAEAGDVVIEFERDGDEWRATLTEIPDEDEEDGSATSVVVSSGQLDEEAVMPYGIRSGGSDCPHEVYNTETDERAPGGCHPTRREALDHQRALMAHEETASRVSEVAGSEGDAGGKPNPGTDPDRRLKANQAKAKKRRGSAQSDGEPEPDEIAHGAEMEPQPGEHFHAIMHTEGKSTGMRTFLNLSWREPPFSFHWQKSSSAHGGQPQTVQVGLTGRVERDHYDESIIHGWGGLDLGSEDGREYARRLVGGFERWVSIGLDETPFETTIEWPESDDDDDEGGLLAFLLGGQPEQVTIDGGRIGELTGVSVPAQDDAIIEPTQELIDALADMGEGDAIGLARGHNEWERTQAQLDVPADGSLSPEISGDGSGEALPEIDDGHFATSSDAQVDFGDWDGNAAMSSCNDAACYRAICAGRRAGDPSLRASWALPHHTGPSAPPNANGVRAALGRFGQTQGLTNAEAARSHLERHQSAVEAARERRGNQEFMEIMGSDVADAVEALTASAYRIEIPDLPPAWWFDAPTDVEIPGAFCVTDEGRLYGVLAPLRTGHRAGSRNGGRTRIEAPFGNVDYERFLSKEALTQEGRISGVGAVTMDCGHASRFRPSHEVATEHYDNACSIIGKIRVGETIGSDGKGVVWAAGALEPGVTPAQISRMLACALSGDWQPHPDRQGWSELVAALLVPSEGFPMRRTGPTVTSRSDGVLVASSVPVMHQEPHYIRSVDRDPVIALGLNDIAADAVRRSYLKRIAEPRSDATDDAAKLGKAAGEAFGEAVAKRKEATGVETV